MTTTNAVNPSLPMTCAKASGLANVTHTQAQAEAFKLIDVLSAKGWITEGIDYVWIAEDNCVHMSTALGCTLVERLNPAIHYNQIRQRVLAEEGANA